MKYDLNEKQEVVRLNEDVGTTIFKQLGGNKFVAMIGAKDLVKDKNLLKFSFKARANKGINMITIKLTPKDLYDITFAKFRGMKYTVVEEVKAEETVEAKVEEEKVEETPDVEEKKEEENTEEKKEE